MSKKTRLEKRSSFKKGGMVALMGMSLFPFNPQLASATLFNDPTAADSAFAPVPGRNAKQKNDTYGKSGSATLGTKGQKRIGAAALTGIRNDVSNMVNSVTTNVSTMVDASKTEIMERVESTIVASTKETISTIQASLGDSAPIIHEFTSPVSNQFVQTMPYDGFVVMTVVGAGSGGNAGYNFVAGLGGNAGQFVNEKKVAVTKGTSISVTVGAGGAGAASYTANPQAGGGSLVLIGGVSHAASGGVAQTSPRQSSCPPDAVGVFYRTNNPGDGGSGCSGGYGKAPVDSSNIAFSKAVKGTGGGGTRRDFYWRSGTMALLSGQLDAKFGAGGGGGAPAMLYVPSRGFSQDPINGDGGPGGYSTPGSKGGDGYVRLRIYDPNALITTERFADLVNQGKASNSAVNWEKAITSAPAPKSVVRSWYYYGTRTARWDASFDVTTDQMKVTFSGDSTYAEHYGYPGINRASGIGVKFQPANGSMPYMYYPLYRADTYVSGATGACGTAGNATYAVAHMAIKALPIFENGSISSVNFSEERHYTGETYQQYVRGPACDSGGDGD